jgi:hypothetical protein
LNSEWFKEDRKLPQHEQHQAIVDSKAALRNSTVMQRRLEDILVTWLEATYKDDEDYQKTDWTVQAIANSSRRKTIRQIIQLIDFKQEV